jgi:hypothetical protein
MSANSKQVRRLPWKTPEVRRVHAGSAEAQNPSGTADLGGPGANDFS